jgi:hypothetical protein
MGVGEVVQIMYIYINKCKNDKIKKIITKKKFRTFSLANCMNAKKNTEQF